MEKSKLALRIAFDVTDTFHLSVVEGPIRSVTTSSNNLVAFRDAEAWVWKERPGLVVAPFTGGFDGGATPGDCVRPMVRGYYKYTQAEEFAAHLSSLESPE